ncbi:MAG: hypothetical protein BWK79_18770 [Beggiatoa sp. IS2]|nr:MAG: hypothetical protein BWK79_18770 [Beggiatoa sp. IS2]
MNEPTILPQKAKKAYKRGFVSAVIPEQTAINVTKSGTKRSNNFTKFSIHDSPITIVANATKISSPVPECRV